jgi:hypothetical protein
VTPLWKKLNLGAHERIVVLDAPPEFGPALDDLGDVHHSTRWEDTSWVLAFGNTLAAVEAFATGLTQHTSGDVVAWFAYPKASSRRLSCEFDRDSGWGALGAAGFEPVRQVAIDQDWSALRFRRVEHIARLTRARSDALTDEGRRRTTSQDR